MIWVVDYKNNLDQIAKKTKNKNINSSHPAPPLNSARTECTWLDLTVAARTTAKIYINFFFNWWMAANIKIRRGATRFNQLKYNYTSLVEWRMTISFLVIVDGPFGRMWLDLVPDV